MAETRYLPRSADDILGAAAAEGVDGGGAGAGSLEQADITITLATASVSRPEHFIWILLPEEQTTKRRIIALQSPPSL
jgi:hypothetical protein